jgi:small subunit ribosomal protein S17
LSYGPKANTERSEKVAKEKTKAGLQIGTVTSDTMDKTVVALVEMRRKHPIYKKYIRRSRKYKVHDENNDCRVGDIIRFTQTRPISKDKCHKLVEIVERAK